MSKAEESTTAQWFKNGDHPLDYADDREGFENGELVTFSAESCKAKGWEGAIVRYFRSPSVNGDSECASCGSTAHEHGWLDDGVNGQAVCPGDFIVTTNGRHMVVHQLYRAEAAGRAQQEQDRKDAARYRWLRDNPQWVASPVQVDEIIDKARAAATAEMAANRR